MRDSGDHQPDEFDGEFDDEARRDVDRELSPDEALLWTGRPRLPRVRKVRAMPLLYVVALTSLSGVSLSAMLGIFERPVVEPWVMVAALCLAPVVLGGMIVVDLLIRTVRWILRRRRLARDFYAITDQRAIIGRRGVRGGPPWFFSVPAGLIEGTTRYELADGSGDVYFEGLDAIADKPVGFVEIRSARLVDELIRRTLIDPFPRW